MRGSVVCAVDALCAERRKFQCSEALALEPRFTHGSNINRRDESCGELVASGVCAKVLRQNQGKLKVVKRLRGDASIQPLRVPAWLGHGPRTGQDGTIAD
jgi:hypothetical protein